MKTVIQNGRIIDPKNQLDQVGSIYISDGRIISTLDQPKGFQADQVIDASNAIVTPGFIDLYADLRQPGFEHKGTIATETMAAAANGFTHTVCPPNTLPVVDHAAAANLIKETAAHQGHTYVFPLGALTQGLKGEQLSEMHALNDAGCVGFSNSQQPVKETRTLRRCLEYAATFELPVFFIAEDASLAADGCVNQGPISTRLGLIGIPEMAETVEVAKIILLSEQVGVRVHFSQITTARSLTLIEQAKKDGLPITADVALHQLLFTEDAVNNFNSQFHVRPPLRSEADRQALNEGVRNGTIDAICSAHQPHDIAAKMAPFPETDPGMSTLDSFLPILLTLHHQEDIPLNTLIAAMTTKPASIVQQDLGHLSPGAEANITLFDLSEQWQLSEQGLHSRGKNNPFIGSNLQGRTLATLRKGKLTYQKAE